MPLLDPGHFFFRLSVRPDEAQQPQPPLAMPPSRLAVPAGADKEGWIPLHLSHLASPYSLSKINVAAPAMAVAALRLSQRSARGLRKNARARLASTI